MRTKQFLLSALIALSILFTVNATACAARNSSQESSALPSSNRRRAIRISPLTLRVCWKCATSPGRKLTNRSRRGFELYLKAVDPGKLYLTKADVDEFAAAYASTMATSAKKGDLTPAFVVYNRFLQRVDERCATAQALLDANDADFTVDETFERDKDKIDYPSSDADAADRMRKRVKFEILSLEAQERDKQKEAQKSEGEKSDAAEAVPGRAEDPISKLKRRYSTLQKRLHQTSNDDVLELYLTAIANAYDPHTSYMSPKTYENFSITMGLNLEGIGATLNGTTGTRSSSGSSRAARRRRTANCKWKIKSSRSAKASTGRWKTSSI